MHTLKVDDVLYSSWGYDQTNVDFYQVLKVTPSGVYIRELVDKVTATPGAFMTGTSVPLRDESFGTLVRYHFAKDAPLMFKRAGADNSVRIKSYASAWKWNGEPKRCSWYA